MRYLSEREIEKQKDIYACFIDHIKALVIHELLINLLQAVDLDNHDVQLLADLYM